MREVQWLEAADNSRAERIGTVRPSIMLWRCCEDALLFVVGPGVVGQSFDAFSTTLRVEVERAECPAHRFDLGLHRLRALDDIDVAKSNFSEVIGLALSVPRQHDTPVDVRLEFSGVAHPVCH